MAHCRQWLAKTPRKVIFGSLNSKTGKLSVKSPDYANCGKLVSFRVEFYRMRTAIRLANSLLLLLCVNGWAFAQGDGAGLCNRLISTTICPIHRFSKIGLCQRDRN